MDAITPDGFDRDTARLQRQGCRDADREQQAPAAPGHRPRFIYHPITGVCEHQALTRVISPRRSARIARR
jgi:hypothetical protein